MISTTKITRQKAMGVHYTPPPLGRFIADRLVRQVGCRADSPLRILDPACGDGVLLEAVLTCLLEAGIVRCEVCGVEADEVALTAAQTTLGRFEQALSILTPGDFLDLSVAGDGQREFWPAQSPTTGLDRAFDIVIANPPYVRTQILGSERSQQLAHRFGLSGRVDLYHAFLVAATAALRPGGVMGIITSNRFLTTLGGSAIRSYLARQYDIDEIIDLGDTKLFEAAVLPAIFIGRRRAGASPPCAQRPARFLKVYSQPKASDDAVDRPLEQDSILDVLRCGAPGCYRVPQGIFQLTSGELILDQDPSQVWSLTTTHEAQWLARVRAGSGGLFGDIGAVRVGVKTTADDVFIRSDWDSLPIELRPESELLRPLLRHEDACRWSLPIGTEPVARVLYPHEVSGGRRRAIDLCRYPRAKAYLESHQERLERRHYVAAAGRRWYEIWVPQDPNAWATPKIVFPDISSGPRFSLDLEGRLVDGDSYWITPLPDAPPDVIYLMLGVANSRLMSRFHDLAFNNKLYSARRRYITQYVAKYPYPSLDSPGSRELIALVKQITKTRKCGDDGSETRAIDSQVDALVEFAFGLSPREMAL